MTTTAVARKGSDALTSWYYGLHPTYRLAVRWGFIFAATAVAFHDSFGSLAYVTRNGGIGGYVWTVFGAAVMVAISVARRPRNELPIHDRQTDVIVGTMGLVLAFLIQAVLLPRYETYFYLLRLDLLAMWLFVLSASIVLFGLRPVTRFAWVWVLLFMVFPLPYYLAVVFFGGSKFAAGAATLVISGVATGIALGPSVPRGAVASLASWIVGFAVLAVMTLFFPAAPLLAYQQIPVYIAILTVYLVMELRASRGLPKRLLQRKIEPLAAQQVWAGVPLVTAVAVALSLVHGAHDADDTAIRHEAPGELRLGQSLIAPPGWSSVGQTDYPWVHRFHGAGAVLVRQRMTALTGDARFDKFARPRTLMVDNIVSTRPLSFNVYPVRVLYELTGARLSPLRPVDLGYGVQGQVVSVIDDELLVTWNALRFVWGDTKIAQRVMIFAVDNHEPDAPFPAPTGNLVGTLRTMFTLLLRGNAVLDQRAPEFKDLQLLVEFGRALVAAQFRAAERPS